MIDTAFQDNFSEVGTGKQLGKTSRYRCRWCGFPVNATTRAVDAPETEADGNDVVQSDGEVVSVTANRGCPCCGRYNWAKGVPSRVDPLYKARNPPKRIWKFRKKAVRF